MNELEKALFYKVFEKIEQESKEAEAFSNALWEGGDKPNAQFQDGRSVGMKQALTLIKSISPFAHIDIEAESEEIPMEKKTFLIVIEDKDTKERFLWYPFAKEKPIVPEGYNKITHQVPLNKEKYGHLPMKY